MRAVRVQEKAAAVPEKAEAVHTHSAEIKMPDPKCLAHRPVNAPFFHANASALHCYTAHLAVHAASSHREHSQLLLQVHSKT